MQEIAQEENRIPLPPKASSSLRFLIYGGLGANVQRRCTDLATRVGGAGDEQPAALVFTQE